MQQRARTADRALQTPYGFRIGELSRSLPHMLRWRILVAGLLVSDISLIALAFLVAYLIRFNTSLEIFRLDVRPAFEFYRSLMLVLNPIWAVVFAANGLYDRKNLLGGTQEYSRILRSVSMAMMAVILFSFLQPEFILARGWLMTAWLLTFLFVASGRFWIRRFVYRLRRSGHFLTSTLIVGANEEGHSLAQQLASAPTSGMRVVGFVDNHVAPGTQVHDALVCLGSIGRLDYLIDKHQVEEIVLATSALSREEIVNVFKNYGLIGNLNLRMSSGLFEIITTGLEVKETGMTPLVGIQKVRITGLNRALKLALDYTITLLALGLLSPVLLLIALAIKLDSKGPVLYRRPVMGLNGRQFRAFKFRTMKQNGDEILAEYPELQAKLAKSYKLEDDPRVTSLGRLLRKYSLDELPQLLNVLRGEMSVVGPRMISPGEMGMYDRWGLNLLTVLPGITGLWQISGRSDIPYEQRVRLDMYYIRNWTIWLDLQILWQTVPAVLKSRGAY
ncbi:MAG: sugar transferase [Candidatus Promineifilaceae bacterium]